MVLSRVSLVDGLLFEYSLLGGLVYISSLKQFPATLNSFSRHIFGVATSNKITMLSLTSWAIAFTESICCRNNLMRHYVNNGMSSLFMLKWIANFRSVLLEVAVWWKTKITFLFINSKGWYLYLSMHLVPWNIHKTRNSIFFRTNMTGKGRFNI